jgi:hypothetical protein
MSSTVSLPSEIMPTLAAMALAVMGWSPVTMITWRGTSRPLTLSGQPSLPILPGRHLLIPLFIFFKQASPAMCLEQNRQPCLS